MQIRLLLIFPILIFSQLCLAQEQWFYQNSNTSATLWDVYFVNPDKGWALGGKTSYYDQPIILKTEDGGLNWVEYKLLGYRDFHSVFFIDEYTGWIVGWDGTILKTIDGGKSWTSQISVTSERLDDVYFYNHTIGWAVGRNSTIIKTINSGENWFSQECDVEGWLKSVYFVNADTGWAVGYSYGETKGLILETVDGGNKWTSKLYDNAILYCVQFIDLNVGYAVGQVATNNKALILKTIDGGNSWHTHNINDKILNGVYFANKDTGWVITGRNQAIYKTTDGGETWKCQHFKEAKGSLNSLCFIENVGWAVGRWGYILTNNPDFATMVTNEKIFSSSDQEISIHNYPNPFNSSTRIVLNLNNSYFIKVRIFDITGKLVKTIINAECRAGTHEFYWNPNDISSGLYLLHLKVGKYYVTKKVIIQK